MKRILAISLALLAIAPCGIRADGVDSTLDEFSQKLRFSNADGSFRGAISGTIDLEAYSFDGPTPGLIRTDGDTLWQPRATAFLDFQAGPALYGFAQVRIDSGFDPADRSAEMRLDEYVLRLTPWRDGRLSLQAGQFATVVGRWATRHLSWQNPFITAPLLYESPTRLSDLQPPPSPYYLTYPSSRDAYDYNPVIWGPSYASGFAASGKWKPFEWALELKNTSLMSRPEFWSLSDTGFDSPTLSGRLAWRPDLRWTFGLSASRGSFAGPDGDFPDRDDFQQRLLMLDASFEHRHLQVWAEVARSEFTAPGLHSHPEVVSWFIASRYKVLPRLSIAVRYNEQRYSRLHAYGTRIGPWGIDLRRLDLGITWRFNAHTQIQAQLDHYWSEDERDNRLVLSSRLTVRF